MDQLTTTCECCGWETEAQGDLLTELMRLHDCEAYREDQNQVEHLSQPYVPEETLRAWLL